MIVSIDYDNTYTLHPGTWAKVVDVLERAGVKVVCVTAREATDNDMVELRNALPTTVDVVFSGDKAKNEAAIKAGYMVDVWIDDKPERIKKPFVKVERVRRVGYSSR